MDIFPSSCLGALTWGGGELGEWEDFGRVID